MKRILSIAVVASLIAGFAVAAKASGVLVKKWSSNIVAGTLQPTEELSSGSDQPMLDEEEEPTPEQPTSDAQPALDQPPPPDQPVLDTDQPPREQPTPEAGDAQPAPEEFVEDQPASNEEEVIEPDPEEQQSKQPEDPTDEEIEQQKGK